MAGRPTWPPRYEIILRDRPNMARHNKHIEAVVASLAVMLAMGCGGNDDVSPETPVNPVTPADTTKTDTTHTAPDTPADTLAAKYQVAAMTITTEGGAAITGKTKADYRKCSIAITSRRTEWNYSGTGRIRGRGNSSWLWYDKKPYRIKLDEKAELLGLDNDKDWVLLANYRDPTDMMNNFVFIMGRGLGLPFTNKSRYVEVTLNGDYIGLYELTEQVEVGSGRVDIDKEQGLLLELDEDDGPNLSPQATDNFWSSLYRLPVCVKHPSDPPSDKKAEIRETFAKIERAIKNHDYNALSEQLDVSTFIDYMLIQAFVYNVEVAAPRSIYLYKDAGKKWAFGPLWDFDAGYDFDWSNMYTGHDYFTDNHETVLGTDPANHVSDYPYVNDFFTDMWRSEAFVNEVKRHWNAMKPRIMGEFWAETMKYYDGAKDALERDARRWPIGKTPSTEVYRMENWLTGRVTFMDGVVQGW